LPLLAKRFAPKQGINLTSIKTSNNCDVQRLIYHPFCETEDLGIDQSLVNIKLPIIKCEPEDFNDTVEYNIVRARPCYTEDSQNTANGLGFDKVVDNSSSSLFKCSTPKRQGIKRTFIKRDRESDFQQLMYNPFNETENLIIKQPLMKIQVPIVKVEPEDVNDAVEQYIADEQLKQYHIDDLQNTTGRSLIKIDRRSSSSLSKNSTPKPQHCVDKTAKNYNVDRYVHCKTAKSLGIGQTPALVNMRIVKQEPEDFNDTVEHNIVGARPYSEDSQNTANGLGFDKVVDNGSSSLFQSSTPKRQGIKRTFIKRNRESEVQHLMDNPFDETESLIIKQPLMKIQVPIVKLEPEDINEAVEQNIANVQLKQRHIDDLQNTTGRSLIKIDRRSSSSLSKNSTPKPQHCVDKTAKNYNVDRYVHCKTAKSLGIGQTPALVNMRIVKQEPEDFNDTVEHNIVGARPYSEDSQNTANGLGFDKVVDNGSSSLFQSSTPKRQGIKRTFIKRNRESEVQHLMDNPFDETESLIIKQPLMKIQVPIVKLEPEDINEAVEQNIANVQLKQRHIDDLQNTTGQSLIKIDRRSSSSLSKNCNVDRYVHCKTAKSLGIDQTPALVNMRIVKKEPEDFNDTVEHSIGSARPCYSEDSQNAANGLGFDQVVDNGSSSLFQSSTQKRQSINRTFIKTNRKSDVQHLLDNPFNETKSLIVKQPLMKIQVPIVKLEPEDVNDAVEKNIANVQLKQYHIDDLQNTTGQSLIKIDRHSSSSLSKNSTPKPQHCADKTSKTCKIDRYVHCKTAQSLGIDQTSALVNMCIVKQEPEDFNGTDEQNIVGIRPYYSEDSHSTTSHSLKIGEHFSSSLSKNSAPKRLHINDNKKSKRCSVDRLVYSNTEGRDIGQTLKVVKMPVVKVKTKDINDAVEQNIVKVKGEPCFDNLQNIANSRGFVNGTDVALKHQIINGTYLKEINNCHVNQLIYGPYCKTQEIGIDQMSVEVKSPIVKYEPKSGDNAIEQNNKNNNKMDVVTEDESENEFGGIDLNNTKVDNKDIIIIKGQDILSNGISLKNDNVSSPTFMINNQVNLENEKKKISWEEFRAKKGKLGYFQKYGNFHKKKIYLKLCSSK